MATQESRGVVADDRMAGEPRLDGTRVTVRRIQALAEERGLPAQEVAEQLDVSVADVYDALRYYHEHRDRMEAVERRRDEVVADAFDDRE